MTIEKETIDLEEAKSEIGKAIRRIALLHLAFSEMLVEEFGEEEGKKLIVKAIRNYGLKIGQKARKEVLEMGLEPTLANYDKAQGEPYPLTGAFDSVSMKIVDGKPEATITGCLLAKVWKDYGQEALGRLYCLVDPANFMAYNPNLAFVHVKAEPDGDDHCKLIFRETTPQEREDFAQNRDWSHIDIKKKN